MVYYGFSILGHSTAFYERFLWQDDFLPFQEGIMKTNHQPATFIILQVFPCRYRFFPQLKKVGLHSNKALKQSLCKRALGKFSR